MGVVCCAAVGQPSSTGALRPSVAARRHRAIVAHMSEGRLGQCIDHRFFLSSVAADGASVLR
eukprot:scaffold4124_cov378-Prasinococcus_capsulatus_cf.AAC.8